MIGLDSNFRYNHKDHKERIVGYATGCRDRHWPDKS